MYETNYPQKTPRKVRALLLDEWDNLILLRRIKPTKPIYHVTAGGKVEKGESKVAALHRELREELDATVNVGRPFFTILDTTYYIASLIELGPNPFTGPEFAKESNGKYEIDRFQLQDLDGGIDLQPNILLDLTRHYEGAILAEAARLRQS